MKFNTSLKNKEGYSQKSLSKEITVPEGKESLGTLLNFEIYQRNLTIF
jgi:hypothetical protein